MLLFQQSQRLLERAFKLLSIRDHSCHELQEKLLRKGWSSQSVNDVISYLCEKGYLNDELFAEKYVEYKSLGSPRGLYKLKMELKQKGLDDALINRVLSGFSGNEAALAEIFLKRKSGTLKRFSGEEKKRKVFRMLQNRGFSAETIYRVMESW